MNFNEMCELDSRLFHLHEEAKKTKPTKANQRETKAVSLEWVGTAKPQR